MSGLYNLAMGGKSRMALDFKDGDIVTVNGQRCIVRVKDGGMVAFAREPLPEAMVKNLSEMAAVQAERRKRIEEATGGPPRNRAERRRAARITRAL